MESFQYDPIIHEEHAFRIVRLFAGTGLEIQAEIIHASLDESDIIEYEAVSYVWGSPELTSSIDVEGKSLRITNNLELVLRDLRTPDQDRFLWIDGICIDQSKHKEKTHQVRQMRNIYQRAERVLFHLGHSAELTHILHEALSVIQSQQSLESGKPFELVWEKVKRGLSRKYTSFGTRIRNSVESILSTPWFRRIWIVQEVANARRALIYWGHASFQVAGFVHLVRQLRIKMDDQQASILDMMPQKRRSQSPWSHRQDLYNLLRRFKQAKATQNHDKIFALLGMCTGGKGHGTITVDYEKSEDVVIREVVANISFCEKEDLSDFCHTLESVDDLLKCFDTLLQDLLIYMAANSRLAGLRSLLSNRKDEIVITENIVRAIVSDTNTGPEAVDILLANTPNRQILSVDTLREVVRKTATGGDKDILRIVLNHNSNAKIVEKVVTFSNQKAIQDLLNNSIVAARHLCLAAHSGNLDSVRNSLEEGADINTIGPEGLTPLGCAVENGQRDMIQFLLSSTAHIETGDQSPLSLAAEHGHKDIVQLLLNQGADIEHSDRYGRTPLSLSASGGCRSILSLGRSELGQKCIESSMRLFKSPDLPRVFEHVVGSRRVAGRYEYVPRTCDHDSTCDQIPEVYSEIVDLLLARGANIETRDCIRATPLWWAVNYGHLSAVDKLLRDKAKPGVQDIYGFVPLVWALWNGHQEVTARIFDNGTPVDVGWDNKYLFWAICNGSETQGQWLINKFGMEIGTVVNWAIMSGHASIVKLLLDMNVPTTAYGVEPALSLAASTGHEIIVCALLDHGEDIETSNAMGSTPLMLAAGRGHWGTVRLLLNKTANVNVRDSRGRTPLMYAAREGFLDIVELLVQNHAEVDAITDDHDGSCTSLWQAAQNGHDQVVRLLLEYGADIEAYNPLRITPLMIACYGGHEKTVRLLLEKNASVNGTAQDDHKQTALLFAAGNGHHEVVRLLLEHCAEIETCDQRGLTPLMMASRFGHKESARLLLEQNAMIPTADLKGRTALDWAVNGCHKSIEKMLKERSVVDSREK